MIRYALKCDKDHSFDSWFQSAAAFERVQAAGMISCAICGSMTVAKSLMAPTVRPARTAATAPARVSGAGPDAGGAPLPVAAAPTPRPLSTPSSPMEQALAAMRAEIEANSDYVGLNFAAEARAIHDGDAPARAIWGEAHIDDARALHADGVPVAPLPFLPRRKAN